ncbi:MAG: DUF4974 domain-containing protein [Muribaculaceae bacterium]|nr:DUF4974 domain-containing protein [Muribaculaceae bacterium]
MENYDIMLDLTEHPEKYSPDEVREFLSHPEMKEIYEILCKTSSVLNSNDRISDEFIDMEWQRLNTEYSAEHKNGKPFFKRLLIPSSRIASFVVIILTSMVALAVGIVVSVSVIDKKTDAPEVEKPLETSNKTMTFSDTITMSPKDMKAEVNPVIFEDASLEEILKVISEHYDVRVEFRDQESSGIHLFYKFDSRLPLEDILDQLNTFDRIDIRKEGNLLIVE